MPRTGRPSTYSEEKAERILERVRAEAQGLPAACEAEGVAWGTFCAWLERHPDLSARCARAREAQGDVMDGKIAKVTDDTLSGEVDPAVARVVLSGLQWRASKLHPRRYGDRVQTELSGPSGGPIEMAASREIDERAILIAAEEIKRGRRKGEED